MKVKYLYNLFAALILAVLVSACSGGDSFRVKGKVEGLGTRNLRFYYYDGKALQVGLASAINDEFNFEGRSDEETLITIVVNQTNVLTHVIAENGDDIELNMSLNDDKNISVKGNDDAKSLVEFITSNAKILDSKNTSSINSLIEKQIAGNPDSRLSAALFAIYYDSSINPVHADSVLMTMSEKVLNSRFISGYQSMLARFESEKMSEPVLPLTMYCEKDSMTTFNPKNSVRNLLVFSSGADSRHDVIKNIVDSLARKYDKKKLAIVNIGLESDTAAWKNTIRQEPMSGLNLWMPGSVASPVIRRLNISRIPMYILCDSTGRQIYRGESLNAICDSLSSLTE